uniref:SSD domain-containing protein n=2 Tax=Phaeomonas parva TaxID=124430 RepID=A0A6U4II24_9STRA|mmetsp:Transcript_37906/g.118820  ORF Transcript_37906/g.118820 Transcript_37906/m.118820 type:complete len:755 (+) Transcript_37906:927-3191(+)
MTESVLGYWQYDRDTFEADADWVGTLSAIDIADGFVFSGTLEVDDVMGTYARDGTGRLTSLRALRMTWMIEENLVKDGLSESDPVAEDFEEDFYDYTNDFDPTADGDMHSETDWRFNAVISEAFDFDALLSAVSYTLLTIYACVVMSTNNWVHSRSVLGLVAVGTVGCSIVSGFGFCLAIGVPFSLVVNSVVFVMLGLGVDDAFVIMDALGAITDPDMAVRTKLGRALARAGASITLTSLTDFAAFLVGSSTIIPALRAFCIFASVTILFDFMYQVTLFIAFLKLDEDRIIAKGSDCCCCCAPCCHGCVADPEVACCSKEKNFKAGDERNSLVRRAVTVWLPDFILTTHGKVIVLLAATALLCTGAVGITKLELDFQYEWFVPEGTDVDEVLDIQEDYFAGRPTPVSFYTGDVDYFTYRDSLTDFCTAIEENSDVDAASVRCWYQSFEEETGNAGSNAATEAAFYSAIETYVNGQGARFDDQLVWNDDNTKLVATEIPASLTDTDSTEQDLDAMDSVRNTADEFPELDAIAFSFPFVFFEGLAIVYEETIRNVLLALVVVFIVALIFLADLSAALIVLINIAVVDVCLLGFIHWFGMHINMVIAINVLLAIGLTVDYSAHIAHAYMHTSGTRDERARKALEHIGVSVFNGGATTFIATLALAFARTYVFQVFFRCFVLIVLFGQFFGVIVLPVVLSLVGPTVSYYKEDPDRDSGKYELVSGKSKQRVFDQYNSNSESKANAVDAVQDESKDKES